MVRAVLLATTVMMTAIAAPAWAGSPAASPMPGLSADLSLGGGAIWDSGSYSINTFLANARAALPLGGAFHVETEFRDNVEFQGGENINFISGYAHVYAQNQAYAFGIFGGHSALPSTYNLWSGGLEGQAFVGRLTIDAGVAFQNVDYMAVHGWSARLGGRYYLTPNTRIALTGLYYSFPGGSITGAEGSLEHRFANMPLSVFAKASWGTEDGYNLYSALGGIRISFDNPAATLQGHDKAVPWDSEQSLDTLAID